jgi:hypothetical protein
MKKYPLHIGIPGSLGRDVVSWRTPAGSGMPNDEPGEVDRLPEFGRGGDE